MNTAYSKFPSIYITYKSFIKLQTQLKPFHVLHCGDIPVADSDVQFLSGIAVAK